MDSMRGLSTSLPQTRRKLDAPELLSDFKAAALSVTNLYKTAAASQDKARAAGYQDAVEDILAFLDKENLGLMDGEGWRVRQWATERLVDDGMQRPMAVSEDDVEEKAAEVPQQQQAGSRSGSPETSRKPPAMPASSSELRETSPKRTATSEPPPAYPPARDDFSFRSNQIYPTNHDREASNMDLDTAASSPTSTNTETPPSVRIISHASRSSRNGRHTNHNRRAATTNNTPTINLNLGSGAGNKRKMPYPDFFDISGSDFDKHHDRKDGGFGGGRGGKRGRHV